MTTSNLVTVHADGPIQLTGDLEIAGATDPDHATEAWLCRCGASANKPFCDGSHKGCGFTDAGAVESKGEAEDAVASLKVTFLENGPALLAGPLTVVDGTGAPQFHGTRAALCRCGASSTKPFCDGTHKGAGFLAEAIR